jgi:hypothetical protein
VHRERRRAIGLAAATLSLSLACLPRHLPLWYPHNQPFSCLSISRAPRYSHTQPFSCPLPLDLMCHQVFSVHHSDQQSPSGNKYALFEVGALGAWADRKESLVCLREIDGVSDTDWTTRRSVYLVVLRRY